MIYFYRTLYLCLFPLLSSSWSWGDTYRLQLLAPSQKQITGFSWDSSQDTQEPVLETRKKDAAAEYYVKLKATYQHKDSTLVLDNAPLTPGPEGDLSIEVKVNSSRSDIALMEVDEKGDIKKETAHLVFPQWSQFQAEQSAPVLVTSLPKKWMLSPGLGTAFLSYSQSAPSVTSGSVNQLSLMLKLSFNYILKPNLLELEGHSDISVLPIWNISAGQGLYFLNLKLLATHTIPILKDPWKLKGLLGGYYSTFFSGNFGYKNLSGIHFGISLGKSLSQFRSLLLALGYSALFNGFSILSFPSNSKLDAHLAYQWMVSENKHPVTMFLEFTELKLNILSGGGIQAYTGSTGLTYGF